ncbi:MAG: hypothetical protein JRH11_04650 [Deltaproteobacteria bacterium]|nr:hypothetical protein [Deltaproteobacteria bacterium]
MPIRCGNTSITRRASASSSKPITKSIALDLPNGGNILITGTGTWNQTGGATIGDGTGDIGSMTVLGSLNKGGSGSFTVASDFRCAGTMTVTEGEVSVRGAFRLDETGTFIGGGTDALGMNVRLQVPMASPAVLAGTVRVDAAGSAGRLDILGAVTLASTFVAEVDVPGTGAIPTENLGFLTGGQVLGGTLDVTVGSPPTTGDMFRVVTTVSATGSFDTIIGAGAFTGIVEDGNGVLLTR